jgi:hypothetical protein
MFRCGMAELDVTPSLGVDIPGQLYVRKASGIKDSLYVKAIVFDSGKTKAAAAVIDAVCIEAGDVEIVRKRVSEASDIPKGNIMVCATHSHTAIPCSNLYGSIRDEEYMSHAVKKIADAILLADSRLISAKAGAGSGSCEGLAFNRRFYLKDGTFRTNPGCGKEMLDRPAGPVDPEVTVLRIDDASGKPIGFITNFACHLDMVGGTEFSADYPGELSKMLRKIYGEGIISIFMTGTCGNINHIDFLGEMKYTKGHHTRFGRILSGEVIKVIEKISASDEIEVNSEKAFPVVNKRHITELRQQQAREALTEANPTEALFAEELLEEAAKLEKSKTFEIQSISVGDTAITGFPAEMFVEFGMDLKKRSPFKHNIVSTLTNGAAGYVAIREAFEQGGYETMYTTYTNLNEDAGYIMVEAALDNIRKLQNNK